MENAKFLGTRMVIAAAIVAVALVYHAHNTSAIGRYQFHPSNPPGMIWTIDTVTGDAKARNA